MRRDLSVNLGEAVLDGESDGISVLKELDSCIQAGQSVLNRVDKKGLSLPDRWVLIVEDWEEFQSLGDQLIFRGCFLFSEGQQLLFDLSEADLPKDPRGPYVQDISSSFWGQVRYTNDAEDGRRRE